MARGAAQKMTSKNAKKWTRYEFKNKKRGMGRLNDVDGYCIDSEVKGVAYFATEDQFAIIRTEGFLLCRLNEVPILAQELLPIFRKEIMEIYEDLTDLKNMEVIYAY